MSDTDKQLDLIDNLECHLAEVSTSIANAIAAVDELTETLPAELPSEVREILNFLSAHLSSISVLCSKSENNCSDLQYEIAHLELPTDR